MGFGLATAAAVVAMVLATPGVAVGEIVGTDNPNRIDNSYIVTLNK